jgi:peptidoglycan hydrolase-like protein with peptidoglycan-binding domain
MRKEYSAYNRISRGTILLTIAISFWTAPGISLAQSSAERCDFDRPLFVGVRGDDVRCLQRYLNAGGFTVAQSGRGSSGNESVYFGPLTKNAVARWQATHGVSPALGYFGPISQAAYRALTTMQDKNSAQERAPRFPARQTEGITYYVDPALGDNNNSGTSPEKPWQNPPGTRTADDTAFYSIAWGTVTAQNKIQCGDTIFLKGGSTQTSAQGGGWRIANGQWGDNSGFYTTDCVQGSPITIRVATGGEWRGSAGNFTLDGTGMTATCLRFCGDTQGLVHVEDIDTLTLGGNDASQRLVIKNASGNNIANDLLLTSSEAGAHATSRFIGEWLELSGAKNDGVSVGPAQDLVIRKTISHDNGWSGFSTGELNDHRVARAGFEDVEAYRNGPKGGSLGDQLQFLGCESCYVVRAKSHDGMLRGLNFGNIGNFGGTDMFLLVRDSAFWNNGLSNDNNTVYQSGPCWSGDDSAGGQRQRGVMLRSIIAHNREGGGPCAYGQGWADVWNTIWWDNGGDKSVGGVGDITLANGADADYFGVFNSIVQKRPDGITLTASAPSNFGTKKCPVFDYNLFRPVFADSETLSDFDCVGGNFTRADNTYAAPPAFIGAHTLLGAAQTVGFIATDNDTYGKNDFHLQSGSSAIDTGTFLFRANGAGSGKTITVLGNGGSSDPRHYFLSGASYREATPDMIQIEGCGKATITSMTASTISFTPSCAGWSAGAGVHFPWSGAKPDMGRHEYGL